MTVPVRRLLFATLAGALVLAASPSGAEEKKEDKDNPAAKPIERLNQKGWKDRHERFVETAKKGDVDVLFLGDSITQGWEGNGKEVWKKNLEPLKAANFGIGGDQTGHVLWRITEGKELEGINPKVAILMIGTNNTANASPEQIAGGVEAIVKELRKQKPHMKVLLLAIFPRAEKPDDPRRLKVKETNALLSKLADSKNVVYLDIGDKFLEKDGTISKEIMDDYLHLTARGYGIWANETLPTLQKLLN